jgi:hypothetical protein
MSNISLKSKGVELILPSNHSLDISKGSLTLTLSFNSEGGFSLTQNGQPVAAATPTTPDPRPGTIMPDGTVYAGISPDTGRAFYAAANDEPELLMWGEALERAARKDAHGHKDWRVPTAGELNVLFNNRASIGGFNESDSFPAGWYWSSSDYINYYARNQRFSDGKQYLSSQTSVLSVRCVRG